MKKSSKLPQAKRKAATSAKSRPVKWSIEKSSSLRRGGALPITGDCSCNCGGK